VPEIVKRVGVVFDVLNEAVEGIIAAHGEGQDTQQHDEQHVQLLIQQHRRASLGAE